MAFSKQKKFGDFQTFVVNNSAPVNKLEQGITWAREKLENQHWPPAAYIEQLSVGKYNSKYWASNL